MLTAIFPPSRAVSAPRYDPDLDVIRDPRTGRYSCVYDSKGGRWRARVLKHINLAMTDTEVEAARLVVEWYRKWYGPKWKSAWAARKRNPWRVMECSRKGTDGYIAEVFYEGLPVRVTRVTVLPGRRMPRRPKKYTPGEWAAMRENDIYPTFAEARRAARRVIEREMGLFARFPLLLFWRA